MLRFANPGSDIDGFTRIFQALYWGLIERQPFSLDDISQTLVDCNLATSCGYSGHKALQRSSREDRSRDPLYNQSKMYSELFRLLGWMHPTKESRLTFVFTWLGAHIQEAGFDAKSLVRESVLGIAFPNQVVEAKGDFHLRPFGTIIRTMEALDDILCRDEMIVGPLSLTDDTKSKDFGAMVSHIKTLRGSFQKLKSAIKKHSLESDCQVNTLKNYTRFPLAVLEWSGWTEKVRESSSYQRIIVFHKLTDEGKRLATLLANSIDLRGSALEKVSETIMQTIAKFSAVKMLKRAGFDTSPLESECSSWAKSLIKTGILRTPDDNVIFSPFQELDPSAVRDIFGDILSSGHVSKPTIMHTVGKAQIGRPLALTTTIKVSKSASLQSKPTGGIIENKLRDLLIQGGSVTKSTDLIVIMLEQANKSEFYPAVASLFQCLGYDCHVSRVGVNYQRWDAFIKHPTDSVPIEIKSPGEELFISVKGVRQALENKVILLARESAPTKRETTSLVVGFSPPNDRAEVSELITDIYSAFGLSIGAIDFRSLVLLAASSIAGYAHDSRKILTLRGFIDVASS